MTDLKLGTLLWSQAASFDEMLEAAKQVDSLGYEHLWTWDHLYGIFGDPYQPIFEGWMLLAAWAMATTRTRLGLLVGANTFRNPGLVAKMVTTLDHQSGGRAILGIGAAWFETEHEAFGLPFGEGAPERLRWLAEALPILRGMLRGEAPSATGPHYAMKNVRNDPPPVQARLPIVVGGGGEKVTLKLVAKYADACNIGGGLATVTRKEAILRRHCETVRRDEHEIERTTNVGVVIIRDSEAAARRAFEAIFERNGRARLWHDQPVGTPEQVAEKLAPYRDLGYHHLIAGFPAPYDEESMTRFQTDVRALLERDA